MPNAPISQHDSPNPLQPGSAGASAASARLHGLLDGRPKDEATVAKALEGLDDLFDRMGAKLYRMASMLVGEGEPSMRLVETAVANAEVSLCQDPIMGRKSSRRALAAAALELLARRDPSSLDAPESLEPVSTCIDDDELAAAGISSEDLETMIAGPERDRVREWLESLPTAMRAVFVLRAVAGFTTSETAELLEAQAGPPAAAWTAEAVRQLFRQGLCSLASQLLHAAEVQGIGSRE